jgi:hypothetical protein
VSWQLLFGQRFRREEHPAGAWVHPDGYVLVDIPDYAQARQQVALYFGTAWSNLDDMSEADLKEYFPRGQIGVLDLDGLRS